MSALVPLYTLHDLGEHFGLGDRAMRELRAEAGAGFKVGKEWRFEPTDVQMIVDYLRRKTLQAEADPETPEGADPAAATPDSRSTLRGRSRAGRAGTSAAATSESAYFEALAQAERKQRRKSSAASNGRSRTVVSLPGAARP